MFVKLCPISAVLSKTFETQPFTGEYGFHGEVYTKFELSSNPKNYRDVTYLGTLGPGESQEIKIDEKEGGCYDFMEWSCNSQSLI